MPDYAGLGFVNSFLLVFFSNDNVGKFLRQVAGKQEGKQPKNFMEYLGLIYRMLSSGGVVLPALISDFMRFYFADYFHFELTMAEDVLIAQLSLYKNFSRPFLRSYQKWIGSHHPTLSESTW